MPKAAPARVASPHGGTALAPLPKVPSRRRPLVSEIGDSLTRNGDKSQALVALATAALV
jgi:hypothetical protein